MSEILMTTLFYKELILQGEIWCWSLLGLKGLITFFHLEEVWKKLKLVELLLSTEQ